MFDLPMRIDRRGMNGNDTSSHTSQTFAGQVRPTFAKASMLTGLLGKRSSASCGGCPFDPGLGLKVDGITVALLVIVLLPWLGAVFESLELHGGWKVQYREIRRQLNETKAKTQQLTGATASASQKAELALATNEPGSHAGTAQQLNELVDQYNEARSSQPSSYPADHHNDADGWTDGASFPRIA